MNNLEFNGKVAIVTGGASGLGKSIAMRLAELGADVTVADINIELADKVSKDIEKMGRKSMAFKIDTRNYDEFVKLTEETVKKLGGLDIMVNNAGIGIMKPLMAFNPDEIDRVIDIDLKGTIYGCKTALDIMSKNKSGKIVNISSIAAKVASPATTIYASAKAGVMALTSSLAREAAEFNVNVNCVLPGIVRTEMWENQLNEMAGNNEVAKEEIFKSFTDTIPLKRTQDPVDIANMVAYFCSDCAKNISAQCIAVDGGVTN